MAKQTNMSKKFDNIFLIVNTVLSIASMVLVLIMIGKLMAKDAPGTAKYLALTIMIHILFQVLIFIVQNNLRDRVRVSIVAGLYAVAMVLSFVANGSWVLFYVTTFIVVFVMALNQFLLVSKEKTKKGVITNILFGIALIALDVAVIVTIDQANALNITVVAAVLLLFNSLKRLLFPSIRLEKIRLLLDILIKTHTFDVLICLLTFIIAFSFMFPMVEDNITNFWDAMWYCFAVVTTIGFGDFYATSLAGRILTVVLGIYGIVVVAILTSVIVNFYNEVSSKTKSRDIIE